MSSRGPFEAARESFFCPVAILFQKKKRQNKQRKDRRTNIGTLYSCSKSRVYVLVFNEHGLHTTTKKNILYKQKGQSWQIKKFTNARETPKLRAACDRIMISIG